MSNKKANLSRGFTIVELLIVIVVIAILAAISAVAYNGIQNRAYDTVVKADLSNNIKQIEMYAAESGEYPKGGSSYSAITDAPAPGVVFRVAKSAYDTTAHNVSYCTGVYDGANIWAISVKSKSRNVFLYRSGSSGPINRGNVGHTTTSACLGMVAGTTNYSYGYYVGTDTWFHWVKD